MTWLALDIGGANLKVADGLGYADSKSFPLWRKPQQLAGEVARLLAAAPPAERLAVTMTGELADCFQSKAEGVRAILAAVVEAANGRETLVYLTDGQFASVDQACEQPLLAAASNWHALAQFSTRFCKGQPGLLIDVGSTTVDLVPLSGGQVSALGRNDPERLVAGELVYTGVERSPICAIMPTLPWRGESCPVAQELFATALDAYLVLGEIAEDAQKRDTADGRPATIQAAWDRLARMICADRTMFTREDATRAARAVQAAQLDLLQRAAGRVIDRLPTPPSTIVLGGQGEFLARQLAERMKVDGKIVSLAKQLGAAASRCAPAHALAVLAREEWSR